MSDIVFYFGTECTHCHEMEPLLDEIAKELGVEVEKLEVWHNAENMQQMEGQDKGRCGALPFLYNKKTDKFLCGGNKTREQITALLKGE